MDTKFTDREIEFINVCIERGQSESNCIFKFFSYYMALNFIYNSYRDTRTEYDWESLRKFIDRLFCEGEYSKSEQTEDFDDAFKNFDPLRMIKTKNGLRYMRIKRIEFDRNGNYRMSDLFHNVYKVRCNLFHGSKHMETQRDWDLVEDCTVILEDFLIRFMKFPDSSEQCNKGVRL